MDTVNTTDESGQPTLMNTQLSMYFNFTNSN